MRVTDDEYDHLKTLCESNGGSISDVTRDAVKALAVQGSGSRIDAPVRDTSLALKVGSLERNLATIRQFLHLPLESE